MESARFIEKRSRAQDTTVPAVVTGKDPFLRKTQCDQAVPRELRGDARVVGKRLVPRETQNFPSAEEPAGRAAGWAGWPERGYVSTRSICQLVPLPHSCQITRPIPSRPSHFSSRFCLSFHSFSVSPRFLSAACSFSFSSSLFVHLGLSSLFLRRRKPLSFMRQGPISALYSNRQAAAQERRREEDEERSERQRKRKGQRVGV